MADAPTVKESREGRGDVWVLGRCVPGRPDLGLEGEVTRVRSLDDVEAEEAFAAAALFHTFGPSWTHAVVRLAGERVTQAARAGLGREPDGFDAEAVGWLIRELVSAALVRLDPSITPGPRMSDAIQVALGSEPARVLGLLITSEWSLEVVEVDGSSRVELVVDSDYRIPLQEWMIALMEVLTRVSDGELLDAEADLIYGAHRLAALRAEVVWGLVCLAPDGDLRGKSGAKIGLGLLPFELVDPVMEALRIATARRDGVLPHPGLLDASGADAGDPELPVSDEETSPLDPPDKPSGSAADDLSDEPDRAVIDIAGFLREAMAASSAMEARWSQALNDTRGADLDDLMAGAGLLSSVLMSQIHLDEARHGEPIRLPGLPLQPAVANELLLAPDGAAHDLQHALAKTLAFEDLTRALGALRKPTAGTVDMVDGTVRSWWSQQGFMRVNLLAEQLIRIAQERDLADQQRVAVMSQLALQAWVFGMPEAAVVYLLGALDHTTEATGPLAGAFDVLAEAGAKLASGGHVSLDALVPVVRFWSDELHRRYAGPTIRLVPVDEPSSPDMDDSDA